ncbi:polyprenyl synthetase family protein [Candidatus Sulfidibacterium hydrothermale]|uniref:polyprenyl synthetase family protein n=1 Tax=Candidatus Sulfidibacterium hydrothermale TaxID=2875962 RepID=UPI001F0A46DC|nr:polyprenyl synthetase family protein [Candidatus Sulfidibacterium hydrothermale]UBM62612.1 polyprenyl synthetase family protein [Candidatus Sulfidibacterium hydrothermale]
MSRLREIKKPIAEEIKAYHKVFRETIRSKVPLLDIIMKYILKTKGKEIRPVIVLYTAKMMGGITETTYYAATLIELLHTATLVHDDVVDDSNKRRGLLSINALWKNKIAVLAGDYLLAKGLLLAVETKNPHLLEFVSKATRDMSEGELLQIEKARKLDISEDIYFEIIRKKTASLLASCFATGALSVTNNREAIDKLWKIGELTGIAFQIMDDLLDYKKTSVTGKPTGIDIKEKKITLPLLFLLKNSDKKQQRRIIRTIKHQNKNPQKVEELIRQVRESGGLEYARKKMMEYKEEAIRLLGDFPENEGRKALEEIIHFTINREN